MYSIHSRFFLPKYLKPSFKNSLKFKSLIKNYQEVRIPVPWGHVAGKWWGPKNRRHILTLHGWQENCGSFNRLIPLLTTDMGFLAIDMPGHGYSSRLPSGLCYHYYTDYVLTVQYIMNYLNWSKISLMGHSLGALVSSLYSLLFSKNVDLLICIDGMIPDLTKPETIKVVQAFKKFSDLTKFEMSHEEPPSYSMEDITQTVSKQFNSSILPENCHHVIERNVAPSKVHPGNYYFTRDPRFRLGQILKWPGEITETFAKYVTCPVLYVKTEKSGFDSEKNIFHRLVHSFEETSIDYRFHEIEATHHVHLNYPEKIADIINVFIKKHKTDR